MSNLQGERALSVGTSEALSAVGRQLRLNRWIRCLSAASGVASIGLVGYSRTDFLFLAPDSLQRLVHELAGSHLIVSAAIGLISGLAFLFAERWVVSHRSEAFRSFLLTPISRRFRHLSVSAWNMLFVLAFVLGPAALVTAADFSLGAHFASFFLTMGLLQGGFERLTSSVHEQLVSDRLSGALR